MQFYGRACVYLHSKDTKDSFDLVRDMFVFNLEIFWIGSGSLADFFFPSLCPRAEAMYRTD